MEVLGNKQIFTPQPFAFNTRFSGKMEMYCDRTTVANYLNEHQGWFVRCASPMKAEPFGDHGYTLIVGRYGAFGYDVEPQMSVILEPPNLGHYAMYSVPNPDFNQDGYEVNYRSEMDIEAIAPEEVGEDLDKIFTKKIASFFPDEITRINWSLDLEVRVVFPAFIYKLPINIIQNTGDRLLAQIVKQISPRLSLKVQKDFHTKYDLPIPPKTSRTCEKIA